MRRTMEQDIDEQWEDLTREKAHFVQINAIAEIYHEYLLRYFFITETTFLSIV